MGPGPAGVTLFLGFSTAFVDESHVFHLMKSHGTRHHETKCEPQVGDTPFGFLSRLCKSGFFANRQNESIELSVVATMLSILPPVWHIGHALRCLRCFSMAWTGSRSPHISFSTLVAGLAYVIILLVR